MQQAVGTAEMARRLGSSVEKLRAMANAGEVPYIPIGRKFTFIPENVFAALERKQQIAKATGRAPRSIKSRRRVF